MDVERSSGWDRGPFADVQKLLYDFDWDDRRYIYLAYSSKGLAIIDRDFRLVRQQSASSLGLGPTAVVAFRNGSSYYAIVGHGSPAQLLNVTNPANPVVVRSFAPGLFAGIKSADDERIALITNAGPLEIHSPEGLVTGQAPLQTIRGAFADVTTDGTNFYALEFTGSTNVIHVLRATGGTFSDTTVPTVSRTAGAPINYGAGYLAVVADSHRVVIYRVDGGALTLLHDGSYFAYLQEQIRAMARNALPVISGGQTILVGAFFGLGDVFDMQESPPVTVAKQFTPATILPYESSQLTITISNPGTSDVTFDLTDSYDGIVNSAAAPTTTCQGAVVSAPAGQHFVSISGGVVPAGSNCTVSANVTASISGIYTNTIPAGAVVSTGPRNENSASASLAVERMAAPRINKAFAQNSAEAGVPVRMTITIANPNAGAIQGLALTDEYPSGLANAASPNAVTTCSGATLTATGGQSFVSVAGATVAGRSSCTMAVDVVALGHGTITNTIPVAAVTSANALPNAASAGAMLAASVTGIPTLSHWAVLALAGLIVIAALLRL